MHMTSRKRLLGSLSFKNRLRCLLTSSVVLTLDEGNMLRKVLTKKGTGKGSVKGKLHDKFITGLWRERHIGRDEAQALWDKFEYFSGYGFNKSHAVSYSIISFQCAWLWNYYPAEWMAAFLDKEPESRKKRLSTLPRSMGLTLLP